MIWGRRSPSETHRRAAPSARQVWIETAAPANSPKNATRHNLFTPPAHCLHPQIAKSTNLDHIPESETDQDGLRAQLSYTPHERPRWLLCRAAVVSSMQPKHQWNVWSRFASFLPHQCGEGLSSDYLERPLLRCPLLEL